MSPCLLNCNGWHCFWSFWIFWFCFYQHGWKGNTHWQCYERQPISPSTQITGNPNPYKDFFSSHFSTLQLSSYRFKICPQLRWNLTLEKRNWLGLHIPLWQTTKQQTDKLEAILCALVPQDLGLISIVLKEISKSWLLFPYMSVTHDVIWGAASILKWSGE